MEMFGKLRLIWSNIHLKRRHKKSKRIKKFHNIKNTKSICLIWDGSNVSTFSDATNFANKMHSRGIKVDIICYYPKKELPNEYIAIRNMNSLIKQDIDYFYRPKSKDVLKSLFIKYDILIDMNFQNTFPLFYFTALSKAEFKIGASDTIDDYVLDMCLDIKDKTDIKYYLEQVEYYLEMIHPRVEVEVEFER